MGKRIGTASRRYRNSIITAQKALWFLEQFACGARGPYLTISEAASCLSEHPSKIIPKSIGKDDTKYYVWDVWEYAQWCRARDVLRYFNWDKNSIRIWQDQGMVAPSQPAWFNGEYALTLYDAYRVNKYMRTRSHLMKILGPVPMVDTDSFSVLPLQELCCLLSQPGLVKTLASPIPGAWGNRQ